MNKFERFRQELNEVDRQLRMHRATPETAVRVRALTASASAVIILGPTKSHERKDGTDGRDLPDADDFQYYQEKLALKDFAVVFHSETLGEARVVFDVVEQEEIRFPACRVSWEDKWKFVEVCREPEFAMTMELYLGLLEVLLGCEWSQWRPEIV